MKNLLLFPLLALLFTIAAVGCAGTVANGGKVVEAGSLNKYVRQDLYVKVDGVPAQLGTIVVPRKESYLITIASSHKMDAIFIETCHRHWVEYDKGQQYEFTYTFNSANEREICPLKLSTLEKDGRRKEYATVMFQHADYQLQADVRCNGKKQSPLGVALCQGKVGTLQEAHFQEPVKMFSPGEKCPLPKISEGKDFEFDLPQGYCTYGFSTFSSPHKRLSLTTIGYDAEEYPEEI